MSRLPFMSLTALVLLLELFSVNTHGCLAGSANITEKPEKVFWFLSQKLRLEFWDKIKIKKCWRLNPPFFHVVVWADLVRSNRDIHTNLQSHTHTHTHTHTQTRTFYKHSHLEHILADGRRWFFITDNIRSDLRWQLIVPVIFYGNFWWVDYTIITATGQLLHLALAHQCKGGQCVTGWWY